MSKNISESKIQLKRAYSTPSKSDGYRILVDRLWPRGVSKDELSINDWAKELSPSTELRKEFHESENWKEFQKLYKEELHSAEAKKKIEELMKIADSKKITLVYSAKDEEHNNAQVLAELLKRKLRSKKASH